MAKVADEADIPDFVDRTLPDFLVISQDSFGKRPRVCDLVLQQHPAVKILAVAPDQNYSVHYWVSLDIHSHDVEASEEGILSVLRGGASSIKGQS